MLIAVGIIVGFVFLGGIVAGYVEGDEANKPECPCCGDPIEHDKALCDSCANFIDGLTCCERHEILYDGTNCPKCRLGIFGQKR